MLINNTKIFLGFAVGLFLLQSGYAVEKDAFSSRRSFAASSVRSTMSRREANVGKPVIYGQPEKLYHPIAETLFKSNECVKGWNQLDSLVQPNEGNMFSPQLPQRVRNVVLDVGMFAIDRAVKQEKTEQANVFVVNCVNFLLRDVFEKSEFNSWQDSFAKVVGDNVVSEFLNLVKSNPEQVLSNAIYLKWSELFFGVNGVLQRYVTIRLKDVEGTVTSVSANVNSGRVNTFGLFESLFAETVSERLINRKLDERMQQERTAAEQLRKESEAKIAAENAERDRKQEELERTLARLESAQRRQSNQPQQQQSTKICLIQ